MKSLYDYYFYWARFEEEEILMKREYLFDNIKGIMLFLVALGHLLDVYMVRELYNFEYNLMKYIYLFHMPMFAFVTGYFAKDLQKARMHAVKKVLMPYLYFQTAYVFIAGLMIAVGAVSYNADVFNYSIIVPSSAFFYLLAVFLWKVFANDIMNLKHPVCMAVLLGVLISSTKVSEFHWAYGAVFSLMVFFVLGVKCDKDQINKIRKIPHFISVIILIVGIIPAVYFPYAMHSIRINYQDQGFSDLEGIMWRLIFYCIAFIMGLAIINLVSDKKTVLSQIGKYSILVYAGSTFLSPSGYAVLDHFFGISRSRVLNFVGIVLFCMLIVFIMSREWVAKLYTIIESRLTNFIFNKDEYGEK